MQCGKTDNCTYSQDESEEKIKLETFDKYSSGSRKTGYIENDKREDLRNEIESISDMKDVALYNKLYQLLKILPVNKIQEYHRTIDIMGIVGSAKKVVVIGDIHCDYNSINTLLISLVNNIEYDFINNGYIVCLGDYIDRGNSLMKTTCLLLALKQIMGERCVLLKGNHELIAYKDSKIYSNVRPCETADFLNKYYQDKVDFCQRFVEYFASLPIYCRVLSDNNRYLLVHGGVPKDIFMDAGGFIDEKSGEIIFKDLAKNETQNEKQKIYLAPMLASMMWGDPNESEQKLQSDSSRFEFGAMQFERFMSGSNLNVLIRSHEPEDNGYKLFYKDSKHSNRILYTVFSNGYVGNTDSRYSDERSASCVKYPKFFVIDNRTEIEINDIYN